MIALRGTIRHASRSKRSTSPTPPPPAGTSTSKDGNTESSSKSNVAASASASYDPLTAKEGEWIWTGYWAFGSLPDPAILDAYTKSTMRSGSGGLRADGSSKSTAGRKRKPPAGVRPFVYKFQKIVDAKDVIVPSTLMTSDDDDEDDENGTGNGNGNDDGDGGAIGTDGEKNEAVKGNNESKVEKGDDGNANANAAESNTKAKADENKGQDAKGNTSAELEVAASKSLETMKDSDSKGGAKADDKVKKDVSMEEKTSKSKDSEHEHDKTNKDVDSKVKEVEVDVKESNTNTSEPPSKKQKLESKVTSINNADGNNQEMNDVKEASLSSDGKKEEDVKMVESDQASKEKQESTATSAVTSAGTGADSTSAVDKKVAISVKDGSDSSSMKDPSTSATASASVSAPAPASETDPETTNSQPQRTGSSFSEMGEGETYEEAGWMEEHRMGCPVGGSWKGYFENVSRRKDRMTSRVQEKFHLFFNATPPANARIAFDLDGTAAESGEEKDKDKDGQKDGGEEKDKDGKKDGGEETSEKGKGDSESKPKPVDPGALPPGFLHVRGAGENQFGTFEIVGGYEPETGILTVQRVYVQTTDGASDSKNKNTKSTSTSSAAPVRKSYFTRKRPVVSFKKSGRGGGAAGAGRPSAGASDGANTANTAGGSKKAISSAKKRPRVMSELASPSQLPAESGAMPGAGRRRSASSNALSLPGMVAAAPLAALPSANDSAAAQSQPLRIQSPQFTPKPGGSASTGRRPSPNRALSTPTSRKSKAPGLSKSTSRLTIPKAGNPLDARWRSAHFLYYHRQTEVQSDGQPLSSPSTSNSNPTPVTPTNAKTSFVVYEGEMNEGNNIRDGRGVCLFNNDRVYEGQWKRNKEHGQGALLTADRSRTIYIGDWERGKMHGRGTYYYHMYATIVEEGADPIKGGMYSGEFKENTRNGLGTYNLPDGSMYDGEWRDDEPCGKGTFKWSDGSVYTGHWKNGKRNGWGTLNSTDGFSYEGMWVNNAMEGKGSATYPNGQTYDGSWLNGQRDGRGTIVFGNGAVYKGRFKEDNMEGQGTLRMEHNVAVPLPPRPEVKAGVLSIANDNPKTPVLVTSLSQTKSKDVSTNATQALNKNQHQQTKDRKMKEADSDLQTTEGKEEKKNEAVKPEQNDWMIPIEFQSDIGHIHQKAGFTTGGE